MQNTNSPGAQSTKALGYFSSSDANTVNRVFNGTFTEQLAMPHGRAEPSRASDHSRSR
jgi:hypothetical protein